MAVKIIMDSTTDLAPGIENQMITVPLSIRFGETEYIHGVELDNKEFYRKLVESDVVPTTSQPTPDAFRKEYQKVCDSGDEAVVLTISAQLSGTYQSALIAAEEFGGSIRVVDTKNVAIGAGILAEYALRLSLEGKSAEEIEKKCLEMRERIHLIAMVDTLEYLKKGGRLSAAAAFAGGLLSIKPVIGIRDGELQVLGKARGSRQGNNFLNKEIQLSGGVDFEMPLLLGYTGLSDDLLQKYIEDSAQLWQDHVPSLKTTIVGSVVGTHAGPGAVAVAFFRKA